MIYFQPIILAIATSFVATTPYKNMSLGLEIVLSDTAKVVATSSDPPSCMVQGGAGQLTWHMKIDRVLETGGQTPETIAQMAYERHKKQDVTKILDSRNISIDSIEGWWMRASLYIKNAQDSTMCWLVIPIHGNQSLMVSILTTNEGWDLSGASIMASLQSIRALDPAAVLFERITGLDNATMLLSDLSAESLSPSIGLSNWRRIQQFQDGQVRPNDIGYAHITSRIGTMSEIGTSSTANEEKGLLVEVRSRIMSDQVSEIVTDTVGFYWMSFDGEEEMWSSTTSRWKGKIRTVQKESGIRNRPSLGAPNPKLLILRQDLTSNRQLAPIETIITFPWLPKTLTWVAGPWLAESQPQYLSWRTLNDYVDPPTSTMRSDRVESTKIGFSVSTRMGESNALLVTQYDIDGQLLQRTLGDGVIIFGTNEKTLRSIWEPKDLW